MTVLGRYIVGYTFGNLVLRRRASGAVKRDFRTNIRRYTSPNGYPHSNALLQFRLKLERCTPHHATRHPTKCDVINDVKLFPYKIYRRIYCRKLLTISNQKSRYQSKCIRIVLNTVAILWEATGCIFHQSLFTVLQWTVLVSEFVITVHQQLIGHMETRATA